MAKAPSKPALFIVEDDEAWAASLTGKLGKQYLVNHYASAEEALAELGTRKPELVVLDYHLEGQMTGLDALKRIKKEAPDTIVVMFSAQDDVQIAVNILNNGAYDYVVKGENALNRLQIILRNLEDLSSARRQFVEFKLKVRRERLLFSLLVVFILVGSLVIYLNTCPYSRSIKWDPLGIEQTERCTPPSHHDTTNDKPILE